MLNRVSQVKRQFRGRRGRRKLPATLKRLNLNAVGIDVGATEHFVAVPVERDAPRVRRFETFTADLHALGDWLVQCGIDPVAMESTGMYGIPLYQILEARGLKGVLVNARQVQNVPGRKSDILDCQGLPQLHTYGLLSASFRPAPRIRFASCAVPCVNGRVWGSQPASTPSTGKRPSAR